MDNRSGDNRFELMGLRKVAPLLVSCFKNVVGSRFSPQNLFAAMAIDKEEITRLLKTSLSKGHIRPRQALALLSANMMDHPESGGDQIEFLRNAIRLYNAKTFDEVCEAEEAPARSERWKELKSIYDDSYGRDEVLRISLLKQSCYIRDIVRARSIFEDKKGGFDFQFNEKEIQEILSCYNPHDETSRKETSETGVETDTTSAFPVKAITSTLQQLKSQGRVNETQCGLMLCYILHAMETRRDKSCYVDHPMAVAGYVQTHGLNILGSEEMVWKASLMALLHDIGEENPALNLARDLKGLLPDDVLEAVCLLHKKDGQPYFGYINQIATNKLASFVKLCDLRHNSDGSPKTQEKQNFVYALAADYLQEMIVYPHKAGRIEIAAFAQGKIGYTADEFEWINSLANKIERSRPEQLKKKCPPVTDDLFANLMKRIQEEARLNANTRRNEISPVLA